MLAGSCAGFPTGLLPRSAHKAAAAHPARDGAGMPSLSSCLHCWPRSSGPRAPALLFSQGWLLLGAFGGPTGRMAEGFTCVTQCPHGRGRWYLYARQKKKQNTGVASQIFSLGAQTFQGSLSQLKCYWTAAWLILASGVTGNTQRLQTKHLKPESTILHSL